MNKVLLEAIIGLVGLIFPSWLVWRAYRTSKDLDARLSAGDASLLEDDRFTVDRVTLGPPGTHLVEGVQFVMVSPVEPIGSEGVE